MALNDWKYHSKSIPVKLSLRNIILIFLVYVCLTSHTSYAKHINCEFDSEFLKLKTGCYHFSKHSATWLEAVRMCAERNATLITLDTIEETYAINLHLYHANKMSAYWTSASDMYTRSRYVWMATGRPMFYHEWCHDEPCRRLKSRVRRSNCLRRNPVQTISLRQRRHKNKNGCVAVVHGRHRSCWKDVDCDTRALNGVPIRFICEYNHCDCEKFQSEPFKNSSNLGSSKLTEINATLQTNETSTSTLNSNSNSNSIEVGLQNTPIN